MADKSSLERLQPALLDRLTDDAPEHQTEARGERAIDVRRLREILRRDLAWLLNTNNRDSHVDAKMYPHAANSVLNYGVREISGEFSSRAEASEIRLSIERAIRAFEPRLNPRTLEVVLREDNASTSALVTFDIHAEMWADPIPIELYLRSEVDLTSGELNLTTMS